MGLHKPFDRDLFLVNGNVATTGGAKRLAKGQFAIVDTKSPTAQGARVVSTFAGASPQNIYEFRLGKHNVQNTRTAQNSKAFSSIPWTVKNVTDIQVSAPKTTVQKFDDLIIGYDGINAGTALEFVDGQTTVLDITLSGSPIGMLGEMNTYTFKVHFGAEEGKTNQEIIEDAVRRIKELKFATDVAFTDYVDVKIVDSTSGEVDGVPYVFSTLTLTDSGDSNALALVQAQYPAYKVEVTDRVGQSTEYTILHPQASALADYTTTLASIIKGCADCPGGYTEFDAGIIYQVTIEDDGADLTTTVDNIAGFVAGSVVRKGNENGKGVYTLITSAVLTPAQIATFIAGSAVQSTATFTLVGDVVAICSNGTATSTAWVSGEVCYASQKSYTIQLADNECGTSRLAELQAAYPDLVIEAGASTGNATQTITLSGTSGTGNINIGGEDYLATYASSPTVTATAFVTDNAADILTATGVVVTSSGAVITFAGAEGQFPVTFANLTLTLAGAASAVDFVTTATAGGCQSVYSTTVVTDIVCDECSPIFTDRFTAEAPEDFDFVSWKPVVATADEDALMGIRLTGKPFILDPEEWLKDTVPFYETSVNISVAGGYVEEFNYTLAPDIYNDPFNVKVLSFRQDRDHLGANLRYKEIMSQAYFDGTTRHWNNQFAHSVLGEESVLDNRTQYVSYSVTVQDRGYSQGVGSTMDTAITYHMHAPVGRHQALETLVNSLAVASNNPTVQAFGNLAV